MPFDYDFNALIKESNRTLYAFLNTEANLGLTFARLAEYERDIGNVEHYEKSKANAIRAAETIERLKERLPAASKREIETRVLKLKKFISTL